MQMIADDGKNTSAVSSASTTAETMGEGLCLRLRCRTWRMGSAESIPTH